MSNPSNQQPPSTPNQPTIPTNYPPERIRTRSQRDNGANGVRRNLLNAFTAVEGEDNQQNQQA